MKTIVVAYCVIGMTFGMPSYPHQGGLQLQGIPDLEQFSHLSYPKYEILELGEFQKESLPPAVVQIHQTVKAEVPKPYPVKVPFPVPHPYPVHKPYPVVETKVVHVPHPVPVEVIKKVPVPVEVPKPFPVPVEEFKASHHNGQVDSFGGSFGGGGDFGLNHLSGDGGYEGGYQGTDQGLEGGHAQGDLSGAYAGVSQVQQEWSPIQSSQGDEGGYDVGEQQQHEQQH